MIPSSGGEHPYLLRAFGPLFAFLFSWTGVILTRPVSIAIISVVFGEYIVQLIPHSNQFSSPGYLKIFKKIAAVGCVVILTTINSISNRLGTMVQDVFTALKVISLSIISFLGLWTLMKGSSTGNFDHPFANSSKDIGSYALAFYSASWAYDGW